DCQQHRRRRKDDGKRQRHDPAGHSGFIHTSVARRGIVRHGCLVRRRWAPDAETTAASAHEFRACQLKPPPQGAQNMSAESARPAVTIEYCRQCRWLLRAAWMAQELLSTFEEEVGGVTLVPGTGGVFVVRVGDETVWSRKDEDRFPDIAELKQRVRDRVAPERDLGHADRRPPGAR